MEKATKLTIPVFFFSVFTIFASITAAEIQLWHALDGYLEEQFQLIADEFHREHPEHHVILTRQGNYTQNFEKALQAYREGTGPDMVQIPEYATQDAMSMHEVFFPIEELMTAYDGGFDASRYVEVVRGFYTTSEGRMLSLPWNISTGILYYNQDAFIQAGLDPERPPKTFEELEQYGRALVNAGFIGYTTAWPAAYHVEHIGSSHDVPFASDNNGYSGSGAPLLINAPLYVMHLTKLVQWQKEGIFHYAGRLGETPEELFTSGKAAILMQGANRYGLLARKAIFSMGVGQLPYWAQTIEQPCNPGCGGASFWTLRQRTDEQYYAVADWVNFLSRGDIQFRWHRATGYLPITHEAYELALATPSNPASDTALQTIFMRRTTFNSIRARLPNYPTTREHIVDCLEMALREEKTPQAALDAACEERSDE